MGRRSATAAMRDANSAWKTTATTSALSNRYVSSSSTYR